MAWWCVCLIFYACNYKLFIYLNFVEYNRWWTWVFLCDPTQQHRTVVPIVSSWGFITWCHFHRNACVAYQSTTFIINYNTHLYFHTWERKTRSFHIPALLHLGRFTSGRYNMYVCFFMYKHSCTDVRVCSNVGHEMCKLEVAMKNRTNNNKVFKLNLSFKC